MISELGKPVEILLVEDNEGDILLTMKAFQKAKMNNNLSVCRDGEEALDYIYRRGAYVDVNPTDLILLDLNMPGIGGEEVLKELKNHPELCSIPVIVLTTSDADDDILRSYQLHANSYIKKPVDFQQFGKVIEQLQDYWFAIVQFPSKY